MTRHGEVQVEPAPGVLTHDHSILNKPMEGNNQEHETTSSTTKCHLTAHSQNTTPSASALSTIAIMRRHPMYDCLVLVKRYRPCLDGYSLEFPTSVTNTNTANQTNEKKGQQQEHDCCKIKLVSVYLDGDDPIYQCQERENGRKNGLCGEDGEIVYVPMNGLLDRLDNYDRCGVSIDGKVYAFAMGIRSAEKFLITTNSVREIQETPPL